MRKNWQIKWIILVCIAPIISFIGGFAYFYVLSFLFPLAQTAAIGLHKNSKWSIIWMLNFFYWLLVLNSNLENTTLVLLLLGNSLLGELLLFLIFKKFSNLKWFVFYSLGYSTFFIAAWILIRIESNYELLHIPILFLSVVLYSIVSGYGIKKSFETKTHYNKA